MSRVDTRLALFLVVFIPAALGVVLYLFMPGRNRRR